MEIHRQTCQNCKSKNLRNLIVRIPGKQEKIYVQCRKCRQLVARYNLSEMGYFHHGKGVDSFLRSLENSGHIDSGKNLLNEFNEIVETEKDNFTEILAALEKMDKNDDLDQE